MQKPSTLLEILTAWTCIVGVPGFCIRKGLKNAKRRWREAQSKPGASPRLLVHTSVDVPQELLHFVPLPWLGLKLDVVSLPSRGAIDTPDHKARIIGPESLLGSFRGNSGQQELPTVSSVAPDRTCGNEIRDIEPSTKEVGRL